MTTLAATTDADTWYVLVGGEATETQGPNVQTRELIHTSLSFVCEAYDQLRSSGVPRSRIITIVQLDDYLGSAHLDAVRDVDYPKCMYLKKCERMIREGGADYDYDKVNPATLWSVLQGNESSDYPKVVPKSKDSCSAIFLGVYSHGDSHPSTGSTEERKKDRHTDSARGMDVVSVAADLDPTQHEWYFHLPYPTPVELRSETMSFVATEASKDAGRGRNRPECYFYASQLRSCLASMFRDRPDRPVIALLNYCRSGGALSFMKREATRRAYGADDWPLWLMASSQANHDALVGGLWTSFFDSVAAVVTEASTSSSSSLAATPAPEPPPPPFAVSVDRARTTSSPAPGGLTTSKRTR